MRILLLYPRFPKTFWSYETVLALVNRKVLLPPLGLATVAALLPQDWEFKVVDRNIRAVTDAEWEWADLVMVSAMIVQKEDFIGQIREAKRRDKRVAVGGPYPTSVPEDAAAAGADYLILDEGEITVPMFLAALERGQAGPRGLHRNAMIFRAAGERPALTDTPIPRFDLLELDAYDSMAVQFSRGCPFLCEFCDIIPLYGRRPRTKTPTQFLAELDCLYQLGWRRGVFVVDDNFIGNKRDVKALLRALRDWQEEHGFPFRFNAEASVDLAKDAELMQLMVECNFDAVFVGIETPDAASLSLTKKFQNTRSPLVDSTNAITHAGLRVMAGFIIGFDGEERGAGERIVRFIERTAIPTTTFSMLQALPHTGLWERLAREGRLLNGDGNMNQTTLLNFVPTRPVNEIATEYVEAFCEVYDPVRYLDRAYRYFLMLGAPRRQSAFRIPRSMEWATLRAWLREKLTLARALLLVCWRQGVNRRTRWKFWHHLISMAVRNPRVWEHYLTVCAHNEHFLEYRQIVRDQIGVQAAHFEEAEQCIQMEFEQHALGVSQ